MGWPIGVEVWSEERCNELEKRNAFFTLDEWEESELDYKHNEEEIMKFFREHVKLEANYAIEEIQYSCFCGTIKTNGYFYTAEISQDTGEINIDAYSNYIVKYVTTDKFYPIGIEFWIS